MQSTGFRSRTLGSGGSGPRRPSRYVRCRSSQGLATSGPLTNAASRWRWRTMARSKDMMSRWAPASTRSALRKADAPPPKR